MKLFSELNNENFELYAANNYRNSSCISAEEFYEDLARFKYVLRLLRKYRDSGIIQERLVLNHIIVIYNVLIHNKTSSLAIKSCNTRYRSRLVHSLSTSLCKDKTF